MHAHTAACENGKTGPVVNDGKENAGKSVESGGAMAMCSEGDVSGKGGKEAVKAYDAVVDLLSGQ